MSIFDEANQNRVGFSNFISGIVDKIIPSSLYLDPDARRLKQSAEDNLYYNKSIASGQGGIKELQATFKNNAVNTANNIGTGDSSMIPDYSGGDVNRSGFGNLISQSADPEYDSFAERIPSVTQEDIDAFISGRTDEYNAKIDEWVGDLRGTAQGRYDFTIKWLTDAHEKALGTNDVKRAEFFEQVADKLEQEIGRIPYDYQQMTAREKKDLSDFLKLQNIREDDQLAREKEFKEQQAFATEQETLARREEFNDRGLLDSGIEAKKQQTQERARELSTNPIRRAFDLERTVRGIETDRGKLESQRRLEDLKTQARRSGLDTQAGFDMGTEEAQMTLDEKLANIRQQEYLAKEQAKALATAEAQQEYPDYYV